MARTKVAVTIDERLVNEVDGWVAAGEYQNRSRAIEEGLLGLRRSRSGPASLLAELAKLDPHEERALADELMASDATWPGY